MALSTKTLDALNDSRKTEPHKYIWGQFTPDKEGVGYSDLPEQTNIPDDAKLVLDVNGPSLVTASVKDLKNGIGSLLHDDLATKVNKAGDTMTGTLKMSGNNEVRFGTDDNYYFIKKINNGTFEIYNKNGKGLFLQAGEAHAPSYWDGTKGYRLLTTADLQSLQTQINSLNTEVTRMLGRMNFNARVDFGASNAHPYTVPSKGYLWVDYAAGVLAELSVYINGGILTTINNESPERRYVRLFVPVSEGDVVSTSPDPDHPRNPAIVSGFFVPQV